MRPALIAVALLTFSSTARSVANIVMIVSGSNRPIAMLQVDYMVDGRYERASVVGVIIVLLTLTMVWFARGLTSGRSDKHWDLRYSRQGE